jgi:hypothetical protein
MGALQKRDADFPLNGFAPARQFLRKHTKKQMVMIL